MVVVVRWAGISSKWGREWDEPPLVPDPAPRLLWPSKELLLTLWLLFLIEAFCLSLCLPWFFQCLLFILSLLFFFFSRFVFKDKYCIVKPSLEDVKRKKLKLKEISLLCFLVTFNLYDYINFVSLVVTVSIKIVFYFFTQHSLVNTSSFPIMLDSDRFHN